MSNLTKADIYRLLEAVTDPEIPVLTVQDLGVIRDVLIGEAGAVEVVITPTYSGCPAMDMIEVNIRATLQDAGISPVRVRTVLDPPWTTDWISEEGKAKLRAYGIAPPVEETPDKGRLFSNAPEVPCPHCGASDTRMLSPFGSTPCKAQYQCRVCLEPFDYFKCH